MADHILQQLWEKCSPEEVRRLSEVAQSPYFNKKEALTRLFAKLASTQPRQLPDKELLFAWAYPGQAYHYPTFRYLVSDAAALVLRFWSVSAYEQDPQQQQLTRLEILSARGLNKRYDSARAQDDHPSEGFVQVGDFFYAMQLAALDEQHFERQRQRVFDTRIEVAAVALDKYYYLQRLIYACGMLDREAIFSDRYTHAIPESWFQYLDEHQCFNEPLIAMYYAIWRMLARPEPEAHFLALVALLEAAPIHPELRTPYLSAINFSLRKIRQGDEAYIDKALLLYETGIERGILTDEGGILSPWTLTNVVKLALRRQRFDWTENFIHHTIGMVAAPFRDNALAYNMAEFYYYTRRYDEAKRTLFQVEFNDLNYYLGGRVILAKIYYEDNDTEPLLSLLAAFMIFLKRNKSISPAIKSTYLRFCELLFQLAKGIPNRKDKLYQQIVDAPLLTDREWLLRQLEGK